MWTVPGFDGGSPRNRGYSSHFPAGIAMLALQWQHSPKAGRGTGAYRTGRGFFVDLTPAVVLGPQTHHRCSQCLEGNADGENVSARDRPEGLRSISQDFEG